MSEGSEIAVVKGWARGRAPFLVWPVSQRDFYMSVAFALMPTVVWGMIIFGWRILAMVVAAEVGAGIVHKCLARWTERGKKLVFAHSFMSVLVLVALAHPMWPVWMVGLAGTTIPLMWWLMRGEGRGRLHVAVIWVVMLQAVVMWLGLGFFGGSGTDAILAKDRLLMGDLHNQRGAPLYQWMGSWQLGGDDAMRMRQPKVAAMETLDKLGGELVNGEMTVVNGRLVGAVRAEGGRVESPLDEAFAGELPGVDLLLLGAVSGRVGTVSLMGILIGGLYLAYRTILRPRSVMLFLGSYGVGVLLMTWKPGVVGHLGIAGLWHLWAAIPGELLTLLSYAVLNGDVLFAAVFVLALPGTEPLSPEGRRVFLVVAGIIAAWLDRMNVGLPAATVVLCGLMPAAGVFDRVFAKRSWLNRMRVE